MQRNGSPPPIVQHLSLCLSLILCLPLTWSSSPSFCPIQAPFRCIFLLSHPFSISLSLSMSLASPTSFLFLRCSPSSLPCLLQQKIQHRHQHVFVHAAIRWICRRTSHVHEQIKKWFKKKKKKTLHVCQTLRSKHWLLKVTSQPCKHTPLNH